MSILVIYLLWIILLKNYGFYSKLYYLKTSEQCNSEAIKIVYIAIVKTSNCLQLS